MSAAIGRGGQGSPYGVPSSNGAASSGGGLRDVFTKFSGTTATTMGSPWAFLVAFGIIVVWATTGPLFGFSDTWQLVINTGTTIVTFLMVFLIQNTQNRDAKAIHLKLDELIRAVRAARNQMINVEEDTDEALDEMQQTYRDVKETASATGTPTLPDQPARRPGGNAKQGAVSRPRRQTGRSGPM